jgi:hypothetical protein
MFLVIYTDNYNHDHDRDRDHNYNHNNIIKTSNLTTINY